MTQGQIQRLDAYPHGATATVHLTRDGLTLATVRGAWHARADGHAPGTPWVVVDRGCSAFVHPDDPAVVAATDAALVIRIEL